MDFTSGLPTTMNSAELAVAVDHIMKVWWPQLCRSSLTAKVKNMGIFEEGWYDDNGLLDIQNPAYWKIVNGLVSAIHLDPELYDSRRQS